MVKQAWESTAVKKSPRLGTSAGPAAFDAGQSAHSNSPLHSTLSALRPQPSPACTTTLNTVRHGVGGGGGGRLGATMHAASSYTTATAESTKPPAPSAVSQSIPYCLPPLHARCDIDMLGLPVDDIPPAIPHPPSPQRLHRRRPDTYMAWRDDRHLHHRSPARCGLLLRTSHARLAPHSRRRFMPADHPPPSKLDSVTSVSDPATQSGPPIDPYRPLVLSAFSFELYRLS